MSRMKHLLRKLHIGSGGGAGSSGGHGDPHPHRYPSRVGGPPELDPRSAGTDPSSSSATASVSSSSTSPSSSTRGKTLEAPSSESGGNASRFDGPGAGEGERCFSFFEEEYQVQVALAISVSDPDGREDPESTMMEAAKRMSLACNSVVSAAVGGTGGDDAFEEVLSLRYWRYNTVSYDEKLTDGFYDVYGIVSSFNLLGKMPSLVDLQAISVSDNVEYEVVLVNRTSDHTLQQLERKAVSIASECKSAELDPVRSGLVQKIADLVVESMGGPVGDVDAMIKRWRRKSCELRSSLNTIVLPLGRLQVGLSRHRALLFKVLADRIDLPCRLVKGSYYSGTDDGAVNLIKVNHESEYIIDLMGAPGALIPAETPSCYLQNSGVDLINNDVSQTVKDLCLALDKKVNRQFEKTTEIAGGPDFPLETVGPLTHEENAIGPLTGGCDAGNSDANNSISDGDGFERFLPSTNRSQVDACINQEAGSASRQMQVDDVSKYVVTAAKDPEFAQKLHAVLLESGASPPPELFQDISATLGIGEQKDSLGYKFSVEGMMGKQNQDSDASAKPSHQGLCLPAYGEQLNGRTVSHKVDPGNLEFVNSFPEANVRHTQANHAEIVEKIETEGVVPLKNYEKGTEDFMCKFGLSTESGSSSINNGRPNNVLNDVADCEIPWEDLQIGERIGLGSYGEVYRADLNGTEVAVKKFLDQDLSGDALEQFRCEVKIMLRLRHPNVVLFMGAVTRPPNLSILTEFLPRGSLFRLLHRPNTQLDEKRRLRMALDVAKGMNYLHSSQITIVHRDLKSPNLLVDKNWVVKVCDFGLSRLQHHTFLSSKSTAGTPEWMAPEVLRNEPSNEKCDVYSFGVILWELATLRMPWSGMNPMQVVGAVGFQNKRLEIPKEVDPMVVQIICDCWHSESSRRPSFAQLMARLKHLQRLVVDK
uniref:non-specific serine/threonine protein kinase n=1 Tax=Anthurium amnicola TaxID=1678845 RepID=A0A1D1Y538_9ARAE